MLNRLYCVTGRCIGDDDDTADVISASCLAEAETIFLIDSLDFTNDEIERDYGDSDCPYIIVSAVDVTDKALKVVVPRDYWILKSDLGYWNKDQGWLSSRNDCTIYDRVSALEFNSPVDVPSAVFRPVKPS